MEIQPVALLPEEEPLNAERAPAAGEVDPVQPVLSGVGKAERLSPPQGQYLTPALSDWQHHPFVDSVTGAA